MERHATSVTAGGRDAPKVTLHALVEQAKIFRATYRKTQTGGMQKKTRR
jgi:hypothetical protein